MSTEKWKVFGERLKEARAKTGLSQRQLAASIGVSEAAVAHWEKGKTFPTPAHLDAACRVLGAEKAWLLVDSVADLSGPMTLRVPSGLTRLIRALAQSCRQDPDEFALGCLKEHAREYRDRQRLNSLGFGAVVSDLAPSPEEE